MFGKKEKSKRRARPPGSLAQYGIFEMPENLDDIGTNYMDDDDDDADLEAELDALTSGNGTVRKTSRKPISDMQVDTMVAESMKDINVDEEISDGEDDPDLLRELKMITEDESTEKVASENESDIASESAEQISNKGDNTTMDEIIKLLQERLALYQIAEKKAKQANETGRARRYNRGIKVLKELLDNAQAGKSINEADIPVQLPPSATAESVEKVSEDTDPATELVTKSNVPESAPAENIDQETLQLLKNRQQEYKIAAVAWKRAGNMREALQHVNIAKQFDIVIAAVNAGETVDLSDMPPTPTTPDSANTPVALPQKEENETQQHSSIETPSVEGTDLNTQTLETALKERLEIYKRMKVTAENEENSSKARRYGRICKQFENALKLHASGKPIPFDELPTPPGLPPLSDPQQSPATTSETVNDDSSSKLVPQAVTEPISPEDSTASADSKVPIPPPRSQTAKKPMQKVTSRAAKQLMLLEQRQHELKQAALSAKKDGDLELARNYLRQAKGMQPLIEASKGGLPVDMNSIPISPLAKLELDTHGITGQVDDNFTFVSSEDCLEEASGTDEQIYENLESQLVKQIKWCLSTRDHSKALGDVSGYNRWERLALNYTRDLDMLRVRKRDALQPPQHHYETKTYAIVQSCTDLSDADIEISIIRGVNYSKEADTYVMFEFPYPTDSPPADRTSTVKGSSNPEYQAVFPLVGIIERTSRQCQRVFKRHALKCQVWAKGCSLNPILCCINPRGFFRADSLLGTVTVKLQPLETQCILHESFPLMEGRKPTGGKLELKIRLRNPILTKQIEQITDKWLIIDH